jgi:response regulator RpfG family c-di-GMP phosphodiesterase
MIYAVLAVKDKQNFTQLAQELCRYPVDIHWTDTGNGVLDILSQTIDQGKTVDLVITDDTLADMSGRDLVEQVTMKSPMTNCAAASALSSDQFHDAYEGLGVLMQLPLTPDAESGKKLVSVLKKLNILKS